MKLVLILAFFLVGSVFLSKANADYSFYGVNSSIDSTGRTNISITVQFQEPSKTFKYTFFGVAENLNYSDNLGIAGCSVTIVQTSVISCNFAQGISILKLYFETSDFAKPQGRSFLFSADFSIGRFINKTLFTIGLPEGYVLSLGKNTPSTIPANPDISSDGRRIILTWMDGNVSSDKVLQYQIYYEPLNNSPFPVGQFLFISQIFVTGAIVVGISLYVFFYRIKKQSKVIFSVLDDFEKKVMNIIIANKGEVNQRKIVAETNLSKAKISRVVKNLADRGLIKVERIGKSNKLKIINKKLI